MANVARRDSNKRAPDYHASIRVMWVAETRPPGDVGETEGSADRVGTTEINDRASPNKVETQKAMEGQAPARELTQEKPIVTRNLFCRGLTKCFAINSKAGERVLRWSWFRQARFRWAIFKPAPTTRWLQFPPSVFSHVDLSTGAPL